LTLATIFTAFLALFFSTIITEAYILKTEEVENILLLVLKAFFSLGKGRS